MEATLPKTLKTPPQGNLFRRGVRNHWPAQRTKSFTKEASAISMTTSVVLLV